MTVLEVIQRCTEFLSKKEVEPARLQAELLLAHVLGMARMQLYLSFERVLTLSEETTLRALVRRRGLREPLQHILGSTSFCGLEIQVDRRVLIPRVETELLAEQGWLFLNERALDQPAQTGPGAGPGSSGRASPPLRALDFGTGSGCVAIALAVKCPSARVVALDLSAAALEVARNNAARHSVSDRVDFVQGAGLSALSDDRAYDLIAANPPYVTTGDIPKLQPEVRDYDPPMALDGGPDGLAFFRLLAVHAGRLLKNTGKMMLEFGDRQEHDVKKILEDENWIVERIQSDYTQRPRILIARTTT